MSFEGSHMSNPVGLRGPVKTVENAYDMYAGINNWQELEDTMVTPQEYGWTRFSDAWLIPCYLKAQFLLADGGSFARYKGERSTQATALGFRAKRFNINNMLNVAQALIHQGLLSPADLKEILERPIREKPGISGWVLTDLYAFWAKQLVIKSVEETDDYDITATAFGVDTDVIEWWMDLEVEDPRAI